MDASRPTRRAVIGAAASIASPAFAAPADGWSERAFRAADSASIHYQVKGLGPSVVVVHGAFDSPELWRPAADRLADRYRFFLLRRRGWLMPPPDDGTHPFAREKADIARLLGIAGPGATLFGHSAGGALVLDYARTHPLPGRLVLFEPALPLGGPVGGAALPKMRALIAQHRPDDAFRLFLTDVVHLPQSDVDAFAATPDWKGQVALVTNAPRELAAIDALPHNAAAYARIRAPAWLILTDHSPQHPFHDTAAALAAAWPGLRLRHLNGAGHMAMVEATSAFVEVWRTCLP